MKRHLLFTAAFLAMAIMVCSCTSAPLATQAAHLPSPKDQWYNITNAQNKLMVAVNLNDGDIVYYSDPKEAFQVLLGAWFNYQKNCKPVEAKKEEPKKKEKIK